LFAGENSKVPNLVRGVIPTTLVTAAPAINSTRISARLLVMLGILGFAASLSAAAADAYSADAVKAEFLYRFAGYVEWPGDPPSGTPFTIGVTAMDGVFTELQRLTAGRTAQNRPVEVRRVSAAADLEKVQILYVPSKVTQSARLLLAAALGRPILVVTDEAGGLVRGSIVNFVEADRHIRFEISVTAAERSKLKINSGLLSVATHVEGGRPRADVPCWQAPVFGPAAPCSRRTSVARTEAGSDGSAVARGRGGERGS
jgi:hypothetical protein